MSGTSRQPAVSVIVPSYNKPEYLTECLESIRAQTFTDWECIVVSDGSPRVEEIRAAVAAMGDERFRLVEHKENRGLAAARNTGVRESRADLVICVDEDDRILPVCLAEELRALKNSDSEIVCCLPEYFGGRSGFRQMHIPTLEQILTTQTLPPCGFLFRKTVWEKLGGWDEHPILVFGREDHEWWIRAVSAGARIEMLERVLYQYRIPTTRSEESGSLNLRARQNEVLIRRYILRKHSKLFDQFPQARQRHLRKAYRSEAECDIANSKAGRAVMRYWEAALLLRDRKDFRKALRASLEWVAGRERSERLLALRRRWLCDPGSLGAGED